MLLKTIEVCLPLKICSHLNLGGLVSEHVTLCLALTWWVDLIYPAFRDDVHTFVEAHFWLRARRHWMLFMNQKKKKMKPPVQGNLKHLTFFVKKINTKINKNWCIWTRSTALVKSILMPLFILFIVICICILICIYFVFYFSEDVTELSFPIWHNLRN